MMGKELSRTENRREVKLPDPNDVFFSSLGWRSRTENRREVKLPDPNDVFCSSLGWRVSYSQWWKSVQYLVGSS
jgi:hypothetical protein